MGRLIQNISPNLGRNGRINFNELMTLYLNALIKFMTL